jgi:hypothetical protein
MVQTVIPANVPLARARGDPDPPTEATSLSDARLLHCFRQSQAALKALSGRDDLPKIRGDLLR